MKKRSMLGYQIRKMLIENCLMFLIGSTVVCGVQYWMYGDKLSIVNIENSLLFMMFMIVTAVYMPLKEYINFGFSRKKYYKEQVILSAIRAMFYAAIRSIIHVVFQQAFVSSFMSDFMERTEDAAALYHSVSFVELFLGDFLVYFLFMLVMLITNSFLVSLSIFIGTKDSSPQLEFRRTEKKKKNKTLYKVNTVLAKIMGFILYVVVGVGIQGYYVFQLKNGFRDRMLVIGILSLFSIIFYFYGKRRYQPKYV